MSDESNAALTPGQMLASGLAGAATVTLINETARRIFPAAPRLEELGIRGIARALRKTGQDVPPRHWLFWLSLAGDLLSNGLFYSLAGRNRRTVWGRGAALGLLMGVGAATLPEPLGLGRGPTERTPATRLMTVLWYFMGGLATAAVVSGFARPSAKKNDD